MCKQKRYNKNKKYIFELNEINSNIFEINSNIFKVYAKNYKEASIKLVSFLIENKIITEENINNIVLKRI